MTTVRKPNEARPWVLKRRTKTKRFAPAPSHFLSSPFLALGYCWEGAHSGCPFDSLGIDLLPPLHCQATFWVSLGSYWLPRKHSTELPNFHLNCVAEQQKWMVEVSGSQISRAGNVARNAVLRSCKAISVALRCCKFG